MIRRQAEYVFKRIEEIYNMKNRWDWKEKLVWKNKDEPNVHRKDWGQTTGQGVEILISVITSGKSIQDIKKVREVLKSPIDTLLFSGQAKPPPRHTTTSTSLYQSTALISVG